MMHGQRNIKL